MSLLAFSRAFEQKLLSVLTQAMGTMAKVSVWIALLTILIPFFLGLEQLAKFIDVHLKTPSTLQLEEELKNKQRLLDVMEEVVQARRKREECQLELARLRRHLEAGQLTIARIRDAVERSHLVTPAFTVIQIGITIDEHKTLTERMFADGLARTHTGESIEMTPL